VGNELWVKNRPKLGGVSAVAEGRWRLIKGLVKGLVKVLLKVLLKVLFKVLLK
jgi:hypothetical protein